MVCLIGSETGHKLGLTSEGYLNFAGRLVAQERNRHIGEFKAAFARAASGAPDERRPFLHRFL
jgi:hypothetical protein